MTRFVDSNILSYKLIRLSSLISIQAESSMSEELAAVTIVIAVISENEKH